MRRSTVRALTGYTRTACSPRSRASTLLRTTSTRLFHSSPLHPLRVEGDQDSTSNSASEKQTAKGLSKDEIAAFEDGSHPSLHTPLTEETLNSIHIATYAAPNTGHIQILTLNEPTTLNAISKSMLSELRAQIDAIHAAPPASAPRALILASGSARAFCAGANLKERAAMTPEETASFLAELRETFTRLAALPIPSIAAIHGPALGGGLELALCTTLRLASADATLALPETGLGIIPGAGGTHRLPALVGRARASRLMLTGQPVRGRMAIQWGLVDYVVAGEEGARERVRAGALRLAARVALKAPLAVRAVLAALNDPRGGQEAENEAYRSILQTQDRAEALRAFKEKRAPVFRGV